MEPLVNLDEKLCTKCYACVRTCPVKAIHLHADDTFPVVNNNWCIGCGDCIQICDPGALTYRSSTDSAKALFESGEPVCAILSPSISAEFDDISDHRKLVTMIKSLGVQHVNEVSFAVDLLAYKYLGLLNDFKGRYYISSLDPIVVNLIEKFHPNLISNLAPLVSPMIAMTRIVRLLYGPEIKVIYIGPEIATKNEAIKYDGDGKIDAVLTFEELRQLFDDYNIDESNLEFSTFDGPLSYKGSLYPLRNGFAQVADIDENLLTTSMFCL